jgi:energy-coupling factor transport system substrate-specific component
VPLRLWLVSILGLALFVVPFVGPDVFGGAGYLPLLGASIAAVLVLLVVEAASRRLDSRRFALLAAIAAIDAALRMSLVSGIGGFSPVFFLMLCSGYVFGPSYGFLVGSVSLLVSAFATGGVGPWLPYEMYAAGWVGAVAGLVGARRTGPPARRDLLVLATTGIVLGFLYGAATDVYDWAAFYRGSPGLGWVPGMGPSQAAARFLKFYLATSAGWDSLRAAGNALMVGLLGAPVLAAMARFRSRFSLVVEPSEQAAGAAGPAVVKT